MNPSQQYPELFALPVEQRQQLAEELWDSIEADADALPVPEWQIEEHGRLGRISAARRSFSTESVSEEAAP